MLWNFISFHFPWIIYYSLETIPEYFLWACMHTFFFNLTLSGRTKQQKRTFTYNYYFYYSSVGVSKGRGSIPCRGKILFLYSAASRSTLWPTLHPIQCVPVALSPEVKWPRREADHSQPVQRLKILVLYFRSPIRLHGVALNYLRYLYLYY
jgi:hypothetical protein